ncbi:uncharacterized protein LOC126670779 isoform X2 [Mercurialis annua]|uniref:uncharacterized protein LOC126670779 isoform X2 n=1 Tax=Mercurialis annua TaxID=3986 RepID=UPI00215F72D8|nr:uncharacterized protein LOC126670779 isoform X2 [Mercurialis annua]
MYLLGQRSGSNPTAILASLMGKREKLREELRNIEKQVYELETSYLQESSHIGHALKGFEGFLSSSKSTTNLKRSRKFQPDDRLFSLSSITSPVAGELGLIRDVSADGRPDFGSTRFKAGNATANGQGKPKKGRASTGQRDVKKIKASSEAEFDDEDDPDVR